MAITTDLPLEIELPYVKRSSNGAIPTHAQMFSRHPDFLDTQLVNVRDVRKTDQTFSISKNGFQYGKLDAPTDIDYTDNAQLVEKYLPVLEQYLKEQLGASTVKAFHWKVRNATYESGMEYTRLHACPAQRPHVDVTSNFAPILFNWDCPDLYKDAIENKKHWKMINIWKPIKTIRRSPVVVANTASVSWDDYLIVPQPDVGPGVEGYWIQKPAGDDRKHDWWYMSEQTPEDVLLFLQHDSEGSQVIPHTSFALPGPIPEEARESVEVRLVVIY